MSPAGEFQAAKIVDASIAPESGMEEVWHDVLRALSLVLDLDQGHKLFHAWRVAILAEVIATELPELEPDRVFYGGLLHDIGSIGLEEHIVHQVLGSNARAPAQDHPDVGARMLASFTPFAWLAPMVRDHHERFDGGGYPRALRGDEIPIEAAVLHLADLLELTLRQSSWPPGDQRAMAAVSAVAEGAVAPSVAKAALRALRGSTGLLQCLYDNRQLPQLVRRPLRHLPALADCAGGDLLEQLLFFFALVIDAKHSYTSGHSLRVTYYALRIVDAIGVTASERTDVLCAGLLHDVGKVGVPRHLLDKAGTLTGDEFEIVQRHAADTVEIMESIPALAKLAQAAASHHERFDGSGYPQELSGYHIPRIGRLLAVADAYDAMTSDRAYRPSLGQATALSRLREARGSQFDPALVNAALPVLEATDHTKLKLPGTLREFREFFALRPNARQPAVQCSAPSTPGLIPRAYDASS